MYDKLQVGTELVSKGTGLTYEIEDIISTTDIQGNDEGTMYKVSSSFFYTEKLLDMFSLYVKADAEQG